MPLRMTLGEAWASGRNNFNLMRLIAACMVIYGHAWAITGASGGDLFAQWTGFRFAGAIAVDMFFVISGFLVAASLERNTMRGYLIARALRILPALLVCIALTACVLGPLLTAAHGYWRHADTWHYVAVNAALWKSAFTLPGVFETLPNHVVNGSLWTLPIEAKLYLALLIASLCGLLAPKRYTPLWALALASAGMLVWIRPQLPQYLVDLLNCTAFFITGTLCWVQRDRIRLSLWPLLALLGFLIVAMFLQSPTWRYAMYFSLLVYGSVMLAFVPRLPIIRRNDLSYGVYLYGWPMQQLAMLAGADTPLTNTAAATVAALCCAALSWFVIEQPALALKRRWSSRPPHDNTRD